METETMIMAAGGMVLAGMGVSVIKDLFFNNKTKPVTQQQQATSHYNFDAKSLSRAAGIIETLDKIQSRNDRTLALAEMLFREQPKTARPMPAPPAPQSAAPADVLNQIISAIRPPQNRPPDYRGDYRGDYRPDNGRDYIEYR